MFGPITGILKQLITKGAGKWFLPSMSPLMMYHRGSPGKPRSTHITLVFRELGDMKLHMLVTGSKVFKPHITLVTRERFLVRVDCLVFLKDTFVVKRHGAIITFFSDVLVECLLGCTPGFTVL